MPKITVGLLYCAMLNVYKSQKDSLNNHWRELEVQKKTNPDGPLQPTSLGSLGRLYLLFLSNLYDMQEFTYNFRYYF